MRRRIHVSGTRVLARSNHQERKSPLHRGRISLRKLIGKDHSIGDSVFRVMLRMMVKRSRVAARVVCRLSDQLEVRPDAFSLHRYH
jgi:hypothetical protein